MRLLPPPPLLLLPAAARCCDRLSHPSPSAQVLVVDSIAEAEQQLTELANGQGALKALEAELDSLAEYANEMSRAKIFTNP